MRRKILRYIGTGLAVFLLIAGVYLLNERNQVEPQVSVSRSTINIGSGFRGDIPANWEEVEKPNPITSDFAWNVDRDVAAVINFRRFEVLELNQIKETFTELEQFNLAAPKIFVENYLIGAATLKNLVTINRSLELDIPDADAVIYDFSNAASSRQPASRNLVLVAEKNNNVFQILFSTSPEKWPSYIEEVEEFLSTVDFE